MAEFVHTPVLLDTFVDALCLDQDGHYVDATFGRGGHSRAILDRLSQNGRLIGLDRDPVAIQEGQRLAEQDSRFQIVYAAFSELDAVLDTHGWETATGVGFDLGTSSPQLEDSTRGFSFQQEGPLDMRMDPQSGQPLSALLARVSERELEGVIRQLGGERYAGRLARTIVRAQHEGRLVTTRDLENVCFHAVPRHARFGKIHPATRTFQALRMWVNEEMDQLQSGVQAAMHRLSPGGRLAVISFHSGEDRCVRDMIEAEVNPCVCPSDFPICACGRTPSMRWIHKKPVRPSAEEEDANPRSRSARLRVAERLA